jgi:hypothetical protein
VARDHDPHQDRRRARGATATPEDRAGSASTERSANWLESRARLGLRATEDELKNPFRVTSRFSDYFPLAGERGYRTPIDDTLSRVIESEHLEADLRRIIREEIRSSQG